MTYISAQPLMADSWEQICYPVYPVWLKDVLGDYDIMATDRQQLIVGEPDIGRKSVFGIQSADYTIIPNSLIREVVDRLVPSYSIRAKHTSTGEFSISIILPGALRVGGEQLQQSMILTNSYNGKTPFSIQGQTFAAIAGQSALPASSMYRDLCQNGLMGWADAFADLPVYREWLGQLGTKKAMKKGNLAESFLRAEHKTSRAPKIHHSRLTPELFQQQLYNMLVAQIKSRPALTATIYEHFQDRMVSKTDESLLKKLPIPVQLAKQAHERLRLEERLLGARASYWLMYNAVNHALFNARSSLTLNDRYKLDERVFHQLAASAFA
ncbi:hypothetical protein ACWKW6_20330 [Dyadobacter jiangsuensis]